MSADHPHIAHRAAAGPPTAKAARLRHDTRIGRLNAKVGLRITMIVGTMWTAYLFTILALVSAPAAVASGDKLIIVAWIAQTFLQLVLLPIIMVGQNVQAKAGDARAQATFDDVTVLIEQNKQIIQLLEARK